MIGEKQHVNGLIYRFLRAVLLPYLTKIGLITEKSDGKFKRIFISYKIGKKDKEILILLRNKNSCKILLYFLFSIICSQIEISNDLEMPPSTVSYYLNKMIKKGIIEEAPVENGQIRPFINGDKVIQRKPTSSEKFYRRKSADVINSVYKLLVVNKHSLFDEDIIDSFIFIQKHIEKQKDQPDKKIIMNINDHMESVIEWLDLFFHPSFRF